MKRVGDRMIVIQALLTAKDGKEEELFQELKKMIGPSLEEDGCKDYILHRSIDDKSVFTFYEAWKDEPALQAHIASPHYESYRQRTEDLIETRDVYRLKRI